jgi:hypothetical protein
MRPLPRYTARHARPLRPGEETMNPADEKPELMKESSG